MKQSLSQRFFIVYLLYALTFGTPTYALESTNTEPQELYAIDQELLLSLTDQELKGCVESIYQKFSESQAVDQLPEQFTTAYQQLTAGHDIEHNELLNALYSFVTWLNERINPEQHNFEHGNFPQSFDIKRGGGSGCCCTAAKLLNQIIFLLVPVVRGIGSPGDTPCEQTIFGILGDACTTLSGQSISQGIAQLEVCCEATLTTLANIETLTALGSIAIELNDTVTTLAALTVELNATLTTINAVSQELQATLTTLNSIQTSVNGTLTALNACCNSTFTALNSIQNTITTDFNQTWTILGDPAATFGKGASISSALLNILQNTSSTTNCCAATFTALAAIQNSVNGTFTAIADVKSTLTTCCNSTFTTLNTIQNTITTDFNNTWTILGNVGAILGQGATISGTLLSIFNAIGASSNNSTLTVLGDVGAILGRSATVSGTLLNLIQDANGTFSVLGNPATILGQGATISGTLLSIYNAIGASSNNSTLTVLGDVGVILGRGATISGTLLSIFNELACTDSAISSQTTISTPGSYCLANNINFTSGNGLTINSSDVEVDLNKRVINGTSSGTNGIVINSGFNNILVKNGTIKAVSNDGIQTNSGCSYINFNSLKIITAKCGLDFIG